MFGIWAEDTLGDRSITHTFNISIALGATSVISGIFIPPVMSIDKSEVKRGDILTFYGSSAPLATVAVTINSDEELIKYATSGNDGTWTYKFNTIELDYGDHTAKARATKDGDITSFSKVAAFKIGDKNVATKPNRKCPSADLNSDCKVNLVDFSILAYWFKRPLSDTSTKYDLNKDGKISLVDFSILAYYWTG